MNYKLSEEGFVDAEVSQRPPYGTLDASIPAWEPM